MTPEILVINATSNIKDEDIKKWADAIQIQVSRDLAPQYNTTATLVFIPKADAAKADAGSWWMVCCDDSDTAGAAGYHDDNPNGLPQGKVFLESCKKFGTSMSATLSHEVLEMLVDPYVKNLVQDGPNLYTVEVCDSPEDDAYNYKINDVDVSDFVYPSFWNRNAKWPYDHQRKIANPYDILPGGYLQYYDTNIHSWTQNANRLMMSQSGIYFSRARIGSRRERRHIPSKDRIRSNLTA